MKIRDFFYLIGNGSMYVLTALQPEQILGLINLGLSILISIVILVSKIVEWYKEAKKDGKITEDEIKDGLNILQNGLEDVKDNLDDKKKGDSK